MSEKAKLNGSVDLLADAMKKVFEEEIIIKSSNYDEISKSSAEDNSQTSLNDLSIKL